MIATIELTAASVVKSVALRRAAVRDALAEAFVKGLARTALSAMLVGSILGVTLFQFVLPMLPWFGSRPDELARIFLFATQHLGDLIAGVLVVGQAGLVTTSELWQIRERHQFTSVAAAGMNPVELFVLPRVWALAIIYIVVGMLFKVTAVVVAAYVNYALDGRFLGPEIGIVLEANARGILGGYALNAGLAVLVGVVCCAPVLRPASSARTEAPIGRVFRHALILIFSAKLLFFVL